PGHVAAESLKANGVDVVFGLNGAHVLGLYYGLADVAVTTAGPGALNSISGVAGAMASGAPLVSLTGAVLSNAALETFHGVDDIDFTERAFASLAKSSRRVTRAADIQAAIGDAFALAVAGRP